jgi:hypothetical protein
MPHVSAFPPVRTWRIHLGAHKTATTHLQDTLRAHRAAMLPHGVDYIPREDFGPLGRRYSRPRGWRKMLRSRPLEWQFTRELQRLRRGPDTVLISDEDLLGYSFDQLTTPLYQRPNGCGGCPHPARSRGPRRHPPAITACAPGHPRGHPFGSIGVSHPAKTTCFARETCGGPDDRQAPRREACRDRA